MVQANLVPQEGGHNYMVAVDGSDASELAFNIAMKGLFRPTKDVFNVCTITNSRKDYLSFQFKPEYIEEKYQAKIYRNAQSGNARFFKSEVEEGKSTKEKLFEFAQFQGADIIVTGMHGRKGPKADLTVAGSAVQYLAQQPVTVAILKDSMMTLDKTSHRFGVLFDGSAIAEKVLQKTLSMLADQDRLSIVSVVEPGMNKDQIRPKAEAICGERPFDCVILENEPNCLIRNRIKMYLKEQDEDENYIDFVCVGNRGLNVGNAVDGENFLGSVANGMISMRRLNVIFIP